MSERTPNPARAAVLRRLDLDRFDLIVVGLLIALTAAIGAVIARGDRVGVIVADGDFGPVGVVPGSASIRVRFSDAMDPASVEARFDLAPDAPGDFRWSNADHDLVFTPRQPLRAGQTYTVTINAGAQTAHGARALHDRLSWSFTVRLPRALYLAPADGFVRHLVLRDVLSGDETQLTAGEAGVQGYALSPDGTQIAYTRRDDDNTVDIWLLDLAGGPGTVRPITNCVDAICSHPAWHPHGTQIAYQRQDFNAGPGSGLGPPRAWVVDPVTLQTTLLFNDPAILGSDPVYAPDGSRIAVHDRSLPGIRVVELAQGAEVTIDTIQDVTGHFAPDGSRLVYPVLVRGQLGTQFYTHLEMADLESGIRSQVSGPEDTPVEDIGGIWSPDGETLLIARRYLDERYTEGMQLYLLDVASGTVEPLVVDPAYNHAAFAWDAAGERVIFQRFSLVEPGANPAVWMVDVNSGDLTPIAANAFLPAWLP